jgi:Domain of unknown function (DUF4383)
MAHTPVNHPLRPLYRALGALTGLYLVVFGVVGLVVTAGTGVFGHTGVRVLGQEANLSWSVISLILGVAVLGATVLGHNRDAGLDTYLGWAMLVVGTYGLATARTDANVFGFSIATVVVSYLIGLVLILTGLYSKVAPPQQTGEPRQAREAEARETQSA